MTGAAKLPILAKFGGLSTSIPPQMILIGLTGNIASGKSEVAKMLADRGATIIDADELAREAVRPETQALRDIVKRWGKDVLKNDGSLDRGALPRSRAALRGARVALLCYNWLWGKGEEA